MSALPIPRNPIPLSDRLKIAAGVVKTLESAGVQAATMSMDEDRVYIYLAKAPSPKQLIGRDIKIIGGPQGLFKVREFVSGMVHVQWVVPHVHFPKPNGSIH